MSSTPEDDAEYAQRMKKAMERVMNDPLYGLYRSGKKCRWVDGRINKYGGFMLPGFTHEDDFPT